MLYRFYDDNKFSLILSYTIVMKNVNWTNEELIAKM